MRMKRNFHDFAESMRELHYGAKRRPHLGEPSEAVACGPASDPNRIAGNPCPKQNVVRKAISLAIVLASGPVPAEIAAERVGRCAACEYVHRVGEKHYCGCCGCPVWQIGRVGSDQEYKTTKAACRCPLLRPRFVEWTETDDGLNPPI
jgi:hypothetical protein